MAKYDELNDLSPVELQQLRERRFEQPELTALAADDAPNRTVIAEGDSWFSFVPWLTYDLIDALEILHGYDVDNHAKAGDTLENMVYGTAVDGDYQPLPATIDVVLEKLRAGKHDVFLFSGGGNDVAGEEFASFLNHSGSGMPSLREDYLERIMGEVFPKYLDDLVARVADASPETQILMHGYGHAIPDGRGVGYLGFTFSGPWLLPALAAKRTPGGERQAIVNRVIDAFNDMLAATAERNPTFHHVDLRSHIGPDDWSDELHLTTAGFSRMSDVVHEAILALP